MSKAWRRTADVVKDLSELNGRRTGAEHLNQYIVEGDRPPRILHEAPDEDELSYYGGHGAPAAGDFGGPDLNGISQMLKMVKNMDDTVDSNEPMTLYLNGTTDEIRISKLNPFAGEYVPGAQFASRNVSKSPKKSNNKFKNKERMDFNENKATNSTNPVPNPTERNIPALPEFTHGNMFKSKSDKVKECTRNENVRAPVQESPIVENKTHIKKVNNFTATTSPPDTNTHVKRKIEKSMTTNDSSNTVSTKEIEEKQEEVISTIIAASTDKSLEKKRQKNVAIATLLKMIHNVETEQKINLNKEHFENPPSNEQQDSNTTTIINKVGKEVPSTSSSETDVNYIDPDSISKVNGWFNNMECPEPKAQVQKPLALKESPSSITFKKKTTSSVTSHNTTASKEKENEPVKARETKAFKPSSYASDLLKKYESNAQQTPLIEDLGTRLERQLRERDELIKQKMLARQNAG